MMDRIRCALRDGHLTLLSARLVHADGSGRDRYKCRCGRARYEVNYAPGYFVMNERGMWVER